MASAAVLDPALNDPALNDPALNDPALNDPALNDPALNEPALTEPALTDADPADELDPADETGASSGFASLPLPSALLKAAHDLGFEHPTAIQEAAIPALMSGRDITGVAQTGTGKTAAFGLPMLAAVDPHERRVQALVLTPTRELAIQVADAITSFAAGMPEVRVAAVYGGASFLPQRAALRAGAQVVVGTPGRIIDHLERGTLDLSAVRFLVLDEADEMLQMGFAEDVDTILAGAPGDRQTALFSATMPAAIRSVAARHMTDPVDIAIARAATTASSVSQTYAVLPYRDKTDALARVLQVATGDAAIVFVRTRAACETVGAALAERGIAAAAISGDVAQAERERIITRLRDGGLDVLVATDVAARGLDVDRIDLVINFDAPTQVESYVHRIGRTGRAGRSGRALTFFTPRETGLLRAIERTTRVHLEQVALPSARDVAAHRMRHALAQSRLRLEAGQLDPYRAAVLASGSDPAELAASLLALAAGDDGTIKDEPEGRPSARAGADDTRDRAHGPRSAGRDRSDRDRADRSDRGDRIVGGPVYRVEVGHTHGVRPAGIVGAITAEGGLPGRDLGKIEIFRDFSTVEFARPLTKDAAARISRAVVSGQRLRIRRDEQPAGSRGTAPARHDRKRDDRRPDDHRRDDHRRDDRPMTRRSGGRARPRTDW